MKCRKSEIFEQLRKKQSFFQSRAQAATEMIIILAIALAVLLGIFVVNNDIMSSTNSRFRTTKAKTAVNDIGDAAELVYQQGVGSKTKVYVNFPNSIESVNVSGKTITISFIGSDEVVYRNLDFDIDGNLPIDEGFYWANVESMDGYVWINVTAPTEEAQLPVCGNNLKETGETCDGTALTPYTSDCSTYPGFDGGTLSCNSNCGGFNTTACTSTDTLAPASVTNLVNQSQDTTWIYWTWTNPVDADFSQAIVYLDGSNVQNTSNAYYNATGLTASTSYTLTVHTKDTNGNVNNTDVTSTTTTPTEVVVGETWVTIFSDNFNRADDAAIGGSWTETGGNWDINSNRAHADDCDAPGDQITSNNIDLSGKTNATLTFDWEYANHDSGECLSLDLNDGSGWVNEVFNQCSTGVNQDASGTQTIYLLNDITLTSTVQLRYDCLNSHHVEDAYIDNVNVSANG